MFVGTCICEEDFGGGDCSINLNDPPLVFAINRETGGLCDINFCKEAVVVGDLFLNRPSLACKMQRFQVYKKKVCLFNLFDIPQAFETTALMITIDKIRIIANDGISC